MNVLLLLALAHSTPAINTAVARNKLNAQLIQYHDIRNYATTDPSVGVPDAQRVRFNSGKREIPKEYTTEIDIGPKSSAGVYVTTQLTGCTLAWATSPDKTKLYVAHIWPGPDGNQKISGPEQAKALTEGGSVEFAVTKTKTGTVFLTFQAITSSVTRSFSTVIQ
ncbi:hypothetical protein GPECTOR_48g426 [Gonium pectorale]|uniref:Uncharacterized protein n=1 Tax=Gonium pectorale TaxID=33097 RepID=A0A150G838_GONPE|nr:hypothetical protein GPECTOR_48g426 [Gonium pectorale]|eukprot:KXZ45994.1 hypothetical protein GPECTOR_48g426 [Gonium pectorale]